MNKAIFAFALLAIIISLGIVEQVYIKKTFDEFNIILIDLGEDIENNEVAKEECTKLITWWNKKRDILECICSHNDTREIMLLLGELEGYIHAEMTEDALSAIVRLMEVAQYTGHILSYSPEHIF